MIHQSPKHSDLLTRFRVAALEDGPLDLRDQVLARLTIALLRRDAGMLASARRQAAEVGISDEEMGHLAALVALDGIDRLESLAGSRGRCCC